MSTEKLDMKLDMKLDTPGLATDIHRRYGYITEFGKEWGGDRLSQLQTARRGSQLFFYSLKKVFITDCVLLQNIYKL